MQEWVDLRWLNIPTPVVAIMIYLYLILIFHLGKIKRFIESLYLSRTLDFLGVDGDTWNETNWDIRRKLFLDAFNRKEYLWRTKAWQWYINSGRPSLFRLDEDSLKRQGDIFTRRDEDDIIDFSRCTIDTGNNSVLVYIVNQSRRRLTFEQQGLPPILVSELKSLREASNWIFTIGIAR